MAYIIVPFRLPALRLSAQTYFVFAITNKRLRLIITEAQIYRKMILTTLADLSFINECSLQIKLFSNYYTVCETLFISPKKVWPFTADTHAVFSIYRQ